MPELTQKLPLANAALSGVFGTTLAAMNDGKVLGDLDEALREVTRAALGAGTKAKLTLELTVMPNGTGAGDTPLIKVVDKIKTTCPKPARDKEPVFFADDNFNPTRRNPNQEQIKFEAIEGGQSDAITKADLKAQVTATAAR
jgi:hypothetical protein